jgi:predicted transglutaminase-like cysteine proteinase
MMIAAALLVSASVVGTPVFIDAQIPHEIPAYRAFCTRYPEAACTNSSAAVVSLDAGKRRELSEVQRTVNEAMTYRSERTDVWTIGGAFGDCEDYVVTKRQRLIEYGLPPNALSFAIVSRHGIQHMVLLVRTTTDVLVLDSLVPEVASWADTRFRTYVWMIGTEHGVWKFMGRRR